MSAETRSGALVDLAPADAPSSSLRQDGFPEWRWRFTPVAVPWVVALAMLAVTAVVFPKTFTFGGLAILTALLGVMVLASLGQSLVIGTGGIDLSVASVMTLSGVAFVIVGAGPDGSTSVAIVVALSVGLVCGLANGIAVEFLKLSSLVVTLATGQVLAGIASIMFQRTADGLSVAADWRSAVGDNVGGVSYILIGSLLFAGVLAVALGHTAAGRRFVAASATSSAAAYLGIHVRFIRAGAYVAAALIYTIAGIGLVGIIGTASLTLGDAYLLTTIVAVVLGGAALSGGRVRPAATVGGALFLNLVNQNLSASGVAPGIQSVLLGVVLIVAMGAGTRWLVTTIRRRRATGGGRHGA